MPRRTAQQSAATRAQLVEVAARLFGERGYAGVGTEQIVSAAGVTRGALYHHFRDKRALFRAVLLERERAWVQRVAERVLAVDDPYERLTTALEAVLDDDADEQLARIAYVDGPAVLGFADWRAVVEETSLGALVVMIEQAMEVGALRRAPAGPLAHLILGALNEAGMVVSDGGDRDGIAASMRTILEGLRT